MPAYKFSDLVDIEKLKESLNYLYKATGVCNAVIDPELNIWIQTGWLDLCTKFHRCHPVTLARCNESDAYIKSHLNEGDYVEYRCYNGLRDIVFPIVVDGEHLASFFFGQFFYEDDPPDYEHFLKQAKECRFDKDAYLEALGKAPVLTRETTKKYIYYYKTIEHMLTNMAEMQKRQLEINKELEMHREHLEELVKERTSALEKAKEDAENSREKAEMANQAKTLFLANMSHELRTPMTAILGYSQLMQSETTLLPTQREYLNIINKSGEQLLTLINDVLELSKIEAGQVNVDVTTFDLHAMFLELESIFRIRTDPKNLHFGIQGIDIVPKYIESDKNKLYRIMINLFSNAVKFTEKGSISVSIEVRDKKSMSNVKRLIVEVKDTGVGIAEDELDKVFQVFEQTESGKKSKAGTGLGLSISRDYARMMGGDITVKSTSGAGSTFTVEIDVLISDELNKYERDKQRSIVGLVPGKENLRVLVADDSDESRSLLVKIIKKAGFHVREAVNGMEAVEINKEWRPHFIWMDIRMPVMDGLEAAQTIKSIGQANSSTTIAAITAHAMEEEKEQILSAGCDDFVRKPYLVEDIYTVMAKHIDCKLQYSDDKTENVPVEDTNKLNVERFQQLPPALLMKLHDAVLRLNTTQTEAILDQIAEHDLFVSSELKKFAKKLKYGILLKFLESMDVINAGGSS